MTHTAMNRQQAQCHMEMRWVPVTDRRGRTHMEARWITTDALVSAAPVSIAHTAA